MSYQGTRARSDGDEARRVFAISQVRLNDGGQVTEVLWSEINAKSNLDVGVPVVVPVADVIDAIHDGARVAAVFPARFGAMPDHAFEVIAFTTGLETIDLVGLHGEDPQGRLNDLARLEDPAART